MSSSLSFPKISTKNLLGELIELPQGFEGEWNIVLVAFRRNHQELVVSWVSWLEDLSGVRPEILFYEIPALRQLWTPVRPFIDGGMASAIRDPKILGRTLTFYGSLKNVTQPLEINDQKTIALFLVNQSGRVLWRGSGAYSLESADEISKVLNSMTSSRKKEEKE